MALNVTRLTGLSSGMDTDTIIKNIMQIEQLKMNRELRARTLLEWKQESLAGVSSDLRQFQQSFMSALSSTNMLTEGAYTKYKAKLTGANTDAVSILADSSASSSKVTINQIIQLAKATSVGSNEAQAKRGISDGTPLDLSASLDTLNLGTALTFNSSQQIKFLAGNTTFSFDSTDSLQDVIDTVNASAAGVTMSYNATSDKIVFTSNTNEPVQIMNLAGNAFGTNSAFGIESRHYYEGERIASHETTNYGVSKNGQLADSNYVALKDLGFANELQFQDGKISFTINDEKFTFSENDTLQYMITVVNSNEKAGVNMNYSRLTDKITLTSKSTGTDSKITVKNETGNAFGEGGAFGIAEGTYQNGQDAVLRIDGVTVTKNSNNFSIDGISYTLNKTTSASEPIEITLEKDIESAVAGIKTFVEGYNTLIKKLEDMLADSKTTREKNYTPLTEEEKASMSEKQIEQWEEIAKKGMLYNDAGLRGLVGDLRDALYASVESAGLSPADIGLQTGRWDEGTKGQIKLDEDRLRAALNKDSEQVMRIFCSFPNDSTSSTAYAETGFLNKITNAMNEYTKGSQAVTLDGMKRSLSNINDKITSMEERMIKLEESYYRKFAAMETAIAKLNAQSDSLVGMLGQATSK